MPKTENDENFKKYQNRIKGLGAKNLVPPVKEPTMSELAAEGLKLLEEESLVKNHKAVPITVRHIDDRKKLDKALAISSTNPYVRARVMILEKLSPLAKNELAEMEKTGNINNKKYEMFVHQVAVLGDKLSNE